MSDTAYDASRWIGEAATWNEDMNDFSISGMDFPDSDLSDYEDGDALVASIDGLDGPSYCSSDSNGLTDLKSNNNRKLYRKCSRNVTSEDDKFHSTSGRKRLGSRLSMSKNAILARENRNKKKQYIDGLAKTVQGLTSENTMIKNKCDSLGSTVESLRREVHYLRNVIANQSTLSTLLKNIPGILVDNFDEQPIDDSAEVDERTNTENSKELAVTADHDYACISTTTSKNSAVKSLEVEKNIDAADAGVCLHVASNKLYLEFCAACNKNAQKSAKAQIKRCS